MIKCLEKVLIKAVLFLEFGETQNLFLLLISMPIDPNIYSLMQIDGTHNIFWYSNRQDEFENIKIRNLSNVLKFQYSLQYIHVYCMRGTTG